MKTKDFALQVKEVSEEGSFEGYGSTFNGAPDSYGDVILPGAFAESLVKHKREGTMPLLLWGHQANEIPIGNWVDMAEDGKGLWGKGQIDLDDPVGQRVHKALKRKSVRGLSIGYETITSKTDPKRPGVRLLEKLEVWEVSIVNFPANRRSLVDAVKSLLTDGGTMPTVREFEGAMRELGFSRKQAEALAKACAPHLRGDPEGKVDELAEFLMALKTA